MSVVLCIDIESSGFGRRSYPIEIAAAEVATGDIRVWLIRPTPAWQASGLWDTAAEAIHGISREKLEAEGQPAGAVAADLAGIMAGGRVLSDNPRHDTGWLRTLYEITGAPPPFELEYFYAYARAIAVDSGRQPETALAEAEAAAWRDFPAEHRAGADAGRLAAALRAIAR